jgi:hypothetical protein
MGGKPLRAISAASFFSAAAVPASLRLRFILRRRCLNTLESV